MADGTPALGEEYFLVEGQKARPKESNPFGTCMVEKGGQEACVENQGAREELG